MDRRKFIKSSAGGLALGVAGPTELGKMVIPNWENISVEEMKQFIVQQDHTLDRIDNDAKGGKYLVSLLGNSGSTEISGLFRDSMKTLLLSGNFVSLSTEAQMHPVVQKRMWDNAPMFEETIDKLVSGIKSLSQEDLSGIKETLNNDPDIEEALEDMLVKEAINAHAPKKRIRRMRKMIRREIKNIKQSPGLVVEKYVHKYDKLMSRVYSEAEIRQYMVANMGAAAYKKKIKEAEKANKRWKELNLGLPEFEELPDPESTEKKEPPKGLKLLGIGAITTLGGWILIGIASLGLEALGWIGVVAGVTVGPILIIVALIMLLVHGIKNASRR